MIKQRNIYAGFWLRLVAYIIDMFVLMGAGFVLGMFLFIIAPDLAGELESQEVLGFILIGIAWIYYASMESSSKQATLGKMALGLKVTDLNKKQISFGRATGRFFGKILSRMLLGMGFFMIAFTEKKQGLHDLLAGCLVLKK